ncbi:MAG TPA: ABC transporter permease subunit [Candidatus Limnocylindria bacterium]|nr:ABC transporter permease subunit [Candidatus Limnocylindria bacterium]
MNLRLLLQTWRWQRSRVLLVGLACVAWGVLFPFFYVQFAAAFKELAQSSPLIQQLMNFGSGSLLTLSGTITLGFQHPLALALIGIFAVGGAALAVAGERQRGTLELLLSRPLSRRAMYASVAVAYLVVVALMVALILAGMILGAAWQDVLAELDLSQLPLVFLNGFLLWAAFTAFSLAASVTFDRSGPALGVSLAYLLVNYFLEILGSLWTDAAWTQEYSLFHHFQPVEILSGRLDPADLLLLGVATLLPIAYALIVFPRRDLAAPS